MSVDCLHLAQLADADPAVSAAECAACVRMGATWVHLRRCQSCGQVGCCDESANRHAREHYRATRHPVVKSLEDGESWSWCYVDDLEYDPTWDWSSEGADLS